MGRFRSLRLATIAIAGSLLFLLSQYEPSPHFELQLQPWTNALGNSLGWGDSMGDVASVIEQLLPDPEVEQKHFHRVVTQRGIRRVVECISRHGVRCVNRPEGKVVIVTYEHFLSTTSGSTTGEVIWCESVLAAMGNLGYTVLTATSQDEMLYYYRLFPELVRIVIMQVRWGQDHATNHIRSCFLNSTCIRSDENPTGVAPWKLFGLTFWGTRGDPMQLHHPYGPSRVLAPYRYPDHYHLGFAIDHHCTKIPVIPHEQRKNQAFILAKRYSYFYDQNDASFSEDTWKTLSEATGLELISVAYDDTKGERNLPEGVTGIGSLPREEFYRQLGSSRALIGNGLPILSPSPLDALCIGVPFIHPYQGDQPLKPVGWNRFRMKFYQHGPLLDLGPPFVYHVPKHNVSVLTLALEGAKTNPIHGRGLPEEYKMASLMKRVKVLVEADWKRRAQDEGHVPIVPFP